MASSNSILSRQRLIEPLPASVAPVLVNDEDSEEASSNRDHIAQSHYQGRYDSGRRMVSTQPTPDVATRAAIEPSGRRYSTRSSRPLPPLEPDIPNVSESATREDYPIPRRGGVAEAHVGQSTSGGDNSVHTTSTTAGMSERKKGKQREQPLDRDRQDSALPRTSQGSGSNRSQSQSSQPKTEVSLLSQAISKRKEEISGESEKLETYADWHETHTSQPQAFLTTQARRTTTEPVTWGSASSSSEPISLPDPVGPLGVEAASRSFRQRIHARNSIGTQDDSDGLEEDFWEQGLTPDHGEAGPSYDVLSQSEDSS